MVKQTSATKGPDNNQRLAFLEEQNDKLAEFFGKPIEGLEAVAGEDPTWTAMRAFNHVEKARRALAADVEDLGRFVRAKRPDAQGSVCQEAIRIFQDQDAEIGRLGNSLRGYKASATKARGAVQVLQAAKSPQARPIGALPPFASDAARHAAEVRFEDALRAGPTTLVFSDGKREIRELAPLIVDGGAWRSSARGHALSFQPLLEPGDMTRPEVRIAGVGLLDEAGEQVGWQSWVEPVVVPRNGRVQLAANTIRFAF